jgi:hypothetical protein
MMWQIVVTLFLKGSVVAYELPHQYPQRWMCDQRVMEFQNDWVPRKKNTWAIFNCAQRNII